MCSCSLMRRRLCGPLLPFPPRLSPRIPFRPSPFAGSGTHQSPPPSPTSQTRARFITGLLAHIVPSRSPPRAKKPPTFSFPPFTLLEPLSRPGDAPCIHRSSTWTFHAQPGPNIFLCLAARSNGSCPPPGARLRRAPRTLIPPLRGQAIRR